jgi:hypothetical protein
MRRNGKALMNGTAMEFPLQIEPAYAVRFIQAAHSTELINLWHLSRVALCDRTHGRWERMAWAAREFSKMHPEVSSTGAYKDLDGLLA